MDRRFGLCVCALGWLRSVLLFKGVSSYLFWFQEEEDERPEEEDEEREEEEAGIVKEEMSEHPIPI